MIDIRSVLHDNKIITDNSNEYKLLTDCYDLLIRPLPTTMIGAQERLSVIDSYRPQLSAILYLLSRRSSDISMNYHNKYDKEFSRLSQLGRPSALAIESEILSKNSDLVVGKYTLEEYENLKVLVGSLMRSLDQSRLSCIEQWRDAKRID